MPTTVNGIGTHYYGKQNVQVRSGHCRSCGAYTNLTSYDTRLWFVVIFIPVIPLGRKRIIDDCASCRRHYAASADEFAMASQLNISEAQEKYRAKPDFESALEAHAKMLGYHQHTQADQLRQEALVQFPKDANLRTAFANHLEEVGRYPDAMPLYEEAYKLDPQLPAARLGVAYIHMNKGELDEARKQLDFMLSPGAGQVYPLGALETLATLYQKEGRHEDALQLFRHLLSEFPDAAQNHEVRKMIRVSEKKVGRFETVLPERTGSWLSVLNPWSEQYSKGQRFAAIGTVVVVLLAIGLAAFNEHIRTHRTLHILSGLSGPITVQVDDLTPVVVKSHERLVVAEGTHKVQVTAPFRAEYAINMNADYLDRFFKSPAWVVNVAGTAPLLKVTVKYANNRPPADVMILAGKTTVEFPDIDYIFEKPPDSIQTKSRNTTITKTNLMVTPVEPMRLATAIQDPKEVLTFVEAHLYYKPDDPYLLGLYGYFARKDHAEARAEHFLKSRLDQRPLQINWHRTYQNFVEEAGRSSELVTVYEGELKKDPDNGELIYLRARVEPDRLRKEKLIEQSLLKAPRSPWPWNMVLYQRLSQADWPGAKAAMKEGTERGMKPELFRHSMRLMQLAMGERATLVKESRDAFAKDADEVSLLVDLFDGLADKPDEARKEFQSWKSRLQSGSIAPDQVQLFELTMLYMIGDTAGLEKILTDAKSPVLSSAKSSLWLATGRPERIVADSEVLKLADDPWVALSLSIAFHSAGRQAEAAEWRGKATAKLSRIGSDEQAAAKILAGNEPPSAETVRKLMLQVDQKLLWLCAVSQKFDSVQSECGDLARKLNVSHASPCLLVRRVFPERAGTGR